MEENMIFDTHAHYDDEQFDPDRDKLLLGMRDRNVGWIVNMGSTADGSRAGVALAEEYDLIYAAVGLHPDEVVDLTEDFLAWMCERALSDPKVVAIGEIGLDYHWKIGSSEVQQAAFIQQMDLARELGLPIAVHSRDAAQDTLELIRAHGQGIPGIIHCFSGSPEMAMEYIKLGYHIGIGGVVTFKNAKKAKEVAARIPMESLVLETDCPYMAPVPCRGRRNTSDLIKYTAAEIARIRGIETEEVIGRTTANAKALFQIS